MEFSEVRYENLKYHSFGGCVSSLGGVGWISKPQNEAARQRDEPSPPTRKGSKAYAHRRTKRGDTGSLGRVRAGRDRGPALAAPPLLGTCTRDTPVVRESAAVSLSLLLWGTRGLERLTTTLVHRLCGAGARSS